MYCVRINISCCSLQQAGLRQFIQCSLIHFLILSCAGDMPETWGKKSVCQGFKTACTLRYYHSTWKTLPNFHYGERTIQLFEVVFLQEYWLQDTWFIFNLAGSKYEPSLLKSLLVGELKNICHLIKKIKGATPWYRAFLVGCIVCLIEHICEREEMGPYFGAGRWQSLLWASPCSDRVSYWR